MSSKHILNTSSYFMINKFIMKKLGYKVAIYFQVLIEAEDYFDKSQEWFFQTKKNIEDITGMKRRTQDKCCDVLLENKLIQKQVKGVPAKNYFKVNLDELVNFISTNGENAKLVQNAQLESTKRPTSSDKNPNYYKEHIYKEHIYKGYIPYKEIIEHLNNKTGKSFNHKSKKTRQLIKKRFEEGYTLEDFKKVIDIKTKEWITDDKMQKYIRPQTLFTNKFDIYLNQKYNKECNKTKEDIIKTALVFNH